MFAPQLFMTIIAHAPLISTRASEVLVQGCRVTLDTVEDFLGRIRKKLDRYESTVAATFGDVLQKAMYEVCST